MNRELRSHVQPPNRSVTGPTDEQVEKNKILKVLSTIAVSTSSSNTNTISTSSTTMAHKGDSSTSSDSLLLTSMLRTFMEQQTINAEKLFAKLKADVKAQSESFGKLSTQLRTELLSDLKSLKKYISKHIDECRQLWQSTSNRVTALEGDGGVFRKHIIIRQTHNVDINGRLSHLKNETKNFWANLFQNNISQSQNVETELFQLSSTNISQNIPTTSRILSQHRTNVHVHNTNVSTIEMSRSMCMGMKERFTRIRRQLISI